MKPRWEIDLCASLVLASLIVLIAWAVVVTGCPAIPSTSEIADCIGDCRDDAAGCLDAVEGCVDRCADLEDREVRRACVADCVGAGHVCVLGTLDCLEVCAREL